MRRSPVWWSRTTTVRRATQATTSIRAFNGGDTDSDNLLDVGETWKYTASTSVTQAELDAGTPIVNVATVTGTGATPDSDDASVAVAQSKILHIEKDATVADGTANSTSDTITYTYTVTNHGQCGDRRCGGHGRQPDAGQHG